MDRWTSSNKAAVSGSLQGVCALWEKRCGVWVTRAPSGPDASLLACSECPWGVGRIAPDDYAEALLMPPRDTLSLGPRDGWRHAWL